MVLQFGSERLWSAIALLAAVCILIGWIPLITGRLQQTTVTNALLVVGLTLGVGHFLRNKAIELRERER